MSRQALKLLGLSTLVILGIVSYIVLAANVPCHLVPSKTTGTTGTTECNGTSGNDVITYLWGFNTKATTINGGAGNDRILIDFRLGKALTINGDDGNDFIVDSEAGSILNGGSGNDRIFGNGGADKINGGPGNDLIDGGAGTDKGVDTSDQVSGGGGNDTFILRKGDAGGTEKIVCTVGATDRSVLRLVGFSKQDLAVQGLRPGILPRYSTVEIREDGTTSRKFEVSTGPGTCLLTTR